MLFYVVQTLFRWSLFLQPTGGVGRRECLRGAHNGWVRAGGQRAAVAGGWSYDRAGLSQPHQEGGEGPHRAHPSEFAWAAARISVAVRPEKSMLSYMMDLPLVCSWFVIMRGSDSLLGRLIVPLRGRALSVSWEQLLFYCCVCSLINTHNYKRTNTRNRKKTEYGK